MKIVKEIMDWTSSIVIAFIVALIVNAFLFQPTKVQGNSMEPTLQNNNYLLISKISHTLREIPAYGEIVIIDSRVKRERSIKDDIIDPVNTYLAVTRLSSKPDRHIWVKRVIARPGDVLEFVNNKVYRNGKILDEPYVKETMRHTSREKITVPENHVFVMGDNRNNSNDSRNIGVVPASHILGKVIFKI
jgi:signal peptidase I